MRITTIGLNYSPEPTGIAVYTTGLSEGLAATGTSVTVITGNPHYPQWRIYDGYGSARRRERVKGVIITRVSHRVPTRPRLWNRLGMELEFGIRAVFTRWNDPDIVLLVTPALFSAGIAALRARLTGTSTCVWVQDIYSLGVSESGTGGRLAAWLLRRVERAILRSATTVVVIHERFKRYLVEELDIDSDTVEVVRNWCHTEYPSGLGREEVRRSRGWKPDDIVVLHAGNMGAKQALENVVNASELAEAQGSAVRFVLLGDGNQRHYLEAMGGNSHIDFIDPLPEEAFTATLAAADILLVNERPGLTEMCVPSKLTTYFNTGLPVIAATDASSVTAEEIALAGGGIRVNAAAPGALLDAAETLGGDAATSAAYGAAGRRFSAEFLTAGASLGQFQRILSKAASGSVDGAKTLRGKPAVSPVSAP
jgi:glycosyltransferase involved in cell wall biosynthesis